MPGRIEGIFVATECMDPLESMSEVQALPGRGLSGDRYCSEFGVRSDPDRQITLIEAEAIESAARDTGSDFSAGRSRRNLVTRHIRLLDLIGCRFTVGPVTLRGIRDCTPCGHLAKLTGCDATGALYRRGGLRAEVLTEGMIRVGDTVARCR